MAITDAHVGEGGVGQGQAPMTNSDDFKIANFGRSGLFQPPFLAARDHPWFHTHSGAGQRCLATAATIDCPSAWYQRARSPVAVTVMSTAGSRCL